MSEPVQPNTETTQTTTTGEPTSTMTEKTGGKTYTEAELEQIVKDRLDREKSKRDKAAAEAAAKAAEEQAAKSGEWEKVAKAKEAELAKLQEALKAQELAAKKIAIAAKIGLPSALSTRLIGETDEEIEKDAKSILDALPKPTPGLAVTNPGTNGSGGETDAQRRRRLGLS